jgi:hypothetical protein
MYKINSFSTALLVCTRGHLWLFLFIHSFFTSAPILMHSSLTNNIVFCSRSFFIYLVLIVSDKMYYILRLTLVFSFFLTNLLYSESLVFHVFKWMDCYIDNEHRLLNFHIDMNLKKTLNRIFLSFCLHEEER